MERPKVLVVAPIPPELKSRLAEENELIERRPAAGETLPGYPVAVTTSMAGIDAQLMAALPDLKLVACNGTGLDRIDLTEAERRGIRVQHTPDAVTEDTADFGLAMMYATVRRMAEADRFVRRGAWKTGRMTPSRRLFSRKLGIVGLGKVGSGVARRAAAIGMDVSYTDIGEKPGVPYRYVASVHELARAVDILILNCPASDATHHLVDESVLEALGPEGYLINISRGSVVKEEALISALQSKAIAGAGLDVYEDEPNIDERLFALENVVLQPHYAAVTAETRHAMASVLSSAIASFFATRG